MSLLIAGSTLGAGAVDLYPAPGAIVIVGQNSTLTHALAPVSGSLTITSVASALTLTMIPALGELDINGVSSTISLTSGSATLNPAAFVVSIAGMSSTIAITAPPAPERGYSEAEMDRRTHRIIAWPRFKP